MTWDSEFAPNPHHGVLTLANCKPVIRKCAKVGDWISGWTATVMHDKNGKIHRFVNGEEKLVYLARITKKITYDEYWMEYPQKRPQPISQQDGNMPVHCSVNTKYDSGDNIYEPKGNGVYIQHENSSHKPGDMQHDLSGIYVLVCDEFYYFGINNPLEVDMPFRIPRWKKVGLDETQLIKLVTSKYKPGIIKPEK